MQYIVEIDNFNGPLDLLLHLLKKDNVRIEDINIEKITVQYLEYINKMEELDLDIASEYLTMAATLIEMKSYILLPKVESLEEEDPRQELINKLIQYKNYKDVTSKLRDLENNRLQVFSKIPSSLSQYKLNEVEEKTESIDILVKAFQDLLKQKELDKPLDTKVTSKEYSLHLRNNEIKKILKKRGKVEFQELFEQFNKDYIVITFLSILDLSKKQELEIQQDNNFDKIYLFNRGD